MVPVPHARPALRYLLGNRLRFGQGGIWRHRDLVHRSPAVATVSILWLIGYDNGDPCATYDAAERAWLPAPDLLWEGGTDASRWFAWLTQRGREQ